MASAKSGTAPSLETYAAPTAAIDAADDQPGNVETAPSAGPEKQIPQLNLSSTNAGDYSDGPSLSSDSQD